MQALGGGGAMLSISASEAEVAGALAGEEGRVSIAAVNGAFGGDPRRGSQRSGGVGEICGEGVADQATDGIAWLPFCVDGSDAGGVRRVAETVGYRPAQIEVVSNVSGQVAGSELSGPQYWVRHVREAVRFADGIAALQAAGVTQYLEIGPKPVLLALVPGCLATSASEPLLLASLRAERSEAATMLEALGGHHAHGGRVNWEAVFPKAGRRLALPTYPWQRKRYWIEASGSQQRSGHPTAHPLAGAERQDAVLEMRQGTLARELAELPQERRLAAVLAAVRAEVARVLSLRVPRRCTGPAAQGAGSRLADGGGAAQRARAAAGRDAAGDAGVRLSDAGRDRGLCWRSCCALRHAASHCSRRSERRAVERADRDCGDRVPLSGRRDGSGVVLAAARRGHRCA